MVDVLVSVLIVLLVGGAVAGILHYAPFIPQPFKQWAVYVVGIIVLVLVIMILLPLISSRA